MKIKNPNNTSISVEISKYKSILIIISSLIFYLVAIFLWQQEKIDNEITMAHNVFFSNNYYLTTAKFISRYGMGLIAFCLAILSLILNARNLDKVDQPLFFYVIITFAFASITGDLLKEFIQRARPVYELSNQIIQTETSSSSSFPSGHATKSMALALSFLIMGSSSGKLKVTFKIITVFIALLVCYSRIVLQKHYLSDILAGIGTALFFSAVSVYLVNFFFKRRKMDEKRLKTMNKIMPIILLALSVLLTLI